MSAQSSSATRRSTPQHRTRRVGSVALRAGVGEIDVLVVSDGVLSLPGAMLGHNADPAVRAAPDVVVKKGMLQNYHSFKFQPKIKTRQGVAHEKNLPLPQPPLLRCLCLQSLQTCQPRVRLLPSCLLRTIGPAFTLASALAGAGQVKM